MPDLFETKELTSLTDNVFKLVRSDWMLITAGTKDHFNTMTANWGGLGYLWNKNVCFCFIRPQRYTYQFVECANVFTLSFFTEDYRTVLNFCGSNSGRDVDKIKECGLTVTETSPGLISFAEARMILECKKIYYGDIDPKGFIDPPIADIYPKKDYHRFYVGEIIKCLVKGKNSL